MEFAGGAGTQALARKVSRRATSGLKKPKGEAVTAPGIKCRERLQPSARARNNTCAGFAGSEKFLDDFRPHARHVHSQHQHQRMRSAVEASFDAAERAATRLKVEKNTKVRVWNGELGTARNEHLSSTSSADDRFRA